MKKALALATALLAGTAVADEEAGPLIKQLGSPHYGTREAAHKTLAKKTDQDTTDKLVEAMKSGDTETARRAADILKPYLAEKKEKAVQEQMQKTRESLGGKYPFIDTAGLDYHCWQTYMAKATGPSDPPTYQKYRHATELLIEDLLRDGRPIEELLQGMKIGELQWIERQNAFSSNKLPPTWP